MKTTSAVVLGLLGVMALFVFFAGATVLGTYNSLAQSEVTVDTSWSNVETQYQRRYDLIGNLVNATKGFLKQEQKVFGDIAEARTRYAGAPSGSNAKVEAASQMDSALSRLLVVMEAYPELKSAETVKGLMDELTGTENRVAIARDRYNEQVSVFNKKVKTFPTNVLAGMFGFQEKAFYKSADGADKAPVVNLES